jgi:SpoIID/LytB domain protein
VLSRLAPVLSVLSACCAMVASSAQGAGTLFIRGGGWGHGIGMSQYGAYGYALQGADYRSILGHYFSATALGHTDPKETMRVLLGTGPAAFSGAVMAATPGAPAKSDKALNANLTYSVRADADGTLALIGPKNKKVGTFAAPLTVSGAGPLQVAGRGAYRGALEFRADGHGGVQTVDAVGLDDYIRGVIAAEMPAGWPAAALEAQAVAARTYAITTSVSGNGYTLYPDTRSQMYGGVGAETPATDAAVAATSGQIVTYHGSAAVTYFFSSSGGHTENVENVWPGAAAAPWLRGVPDPYDGAGGNPDHRWARTLTLPAAQARLGSLVRGSLVGIRVLRTGVSPRILTAQVVGTRGRTTVTGDQLESAFGLPSTYAAFTAVVTLPGPAPRPAAGRPRHSTRAGRTRAARVRAVRFPAGWAWTAMLDLMPPRAGLAVHGAVFFGRRGEVITVQSARGGRWQTVGHARLGSGGSYGVRVAAPGRYRIVYRGLAGPAVGVS